VIVNDGDSNTRRLLPAVDAVLHQPAVEILIAEEGREVVLGWIREELTQLRRRLLEGEKPGSRAAVIDDLTDRLSERSRQSDRSRMGSVINATGVILHTGLGRAPLSRAAITALSDVAGAANVEVDLETGTRRYRGYQLQSAWRTLTGCEDSLLVNNNAAATLLTLQALCADREVVISRGQLIEIGGSFRLPDIFQLSGARLREVGTTNRTRLADYEQAIGPETAAIMHVHPSNYRVVGFSDAPGIEELADLAHARGLTAIDDIGSGSLIDLSRFGLPWEPTFQHSLSCGADLVLGSGDKLLGGPQAGILLGRGELIETIRRYPLARAVRVGKLTLAALSATLDAYLRGTAEQDVPTINLLATRIEELSRRAETIVKEAGSTGALSIEVQSDRAPVGGGSLPGTELPTVVLAVTHEFCPAEKLARQLRTGTIRLFPRIQHDTVLLDLRSIRPEEDSRVALALRLLVGHETNGL